ncbi:MAG: HAMP domain-containing sensor histidine kinase [Pseudomonadota bacterium]
MASEVNEPMPFSRLFRRKTATSPGAATSPETPSADLALSFTGGPGAVVATIDGDGRIVHASGGAADMFAGTRDGAIGVRLTDLFMPEDRAAVETARLAGAQTRLTARARRPDGAVGTFELILPSKTDAAAAALILDRTDEERARSREARSLEAARAEARSGASALADLSHEMKTPLNAVIGFADALREETFGPLGHPRYAEYADHIYASGAHLLDLVKSILDLARIEADRLTLSPVIADPNKVAEECAAMVRQMAEANGLTLTVGIDPSTPECAFDPRAVRQILINLLTNAVKFTSDGAVTISVETISVEPVSGGPRSTAGDSGERLVFTVADTGIGMDAETLAKLGPRFTEAQGAGVRGADGAGLGLSLAFKLADLHGGALKMSSAPGEGVTARLELPLDRSGAMRAAPAAPAPATPLTQLERIEARRRDAARRRARAAA